MGFEVSQKTANKLRALVTRGRETEPAEINGLGTDRYDTFVKVTGSKSGTSWPCVVTDYNPTTGTWTDRTATCRVFEVNGHDLNTGKRYRGLNVGQASGQLVFAAQHTPSDTYDFLPDGCSLRVFRTVGATGQTVEQAPVPMELFDGCFTTCYDSDDPSDDPPSEDGCAGWWCCEETRTVVYLQTCEEVANYVCDDSSSSSDDSEDEPCVWSGAGYYCYLAPTEGDGEGDECIGDAECGTASWIWVTDIPSGLSYWNPNGEPNCSEGCTAVPPEEPGTENEIQITGCCKQYSYGCQYFATCEEFYASPLAVVHGPYETPEECAAECGGDSDSSGSDGSGDDSGDDPCTGWYCCPETGTEFFAANCEELDAYPCGDDEGSSSDSGDDGTPDCGEQYTAEDNWAFFGDAGVWNLGSAGTCSDPGEPPFPVSQGASAVFECRTCNWTYGEPA